MKTTRRDFLKSAAAGGVLAAAVSAGIDSLLAGDVLAAEPGKSAAFDAVLDEFLASLDAALADGENAILASTREAADAIVAGGKFAVWGENKSITGEAIGRASGFMMDQWSDKVRDSKGQAWRDVLVVVADSSANEALLKTALAAKENGGLVIGFKPGGPVEGIDPFVNACSHCIYTRGRAGAHEGFGSTVGALNIALLWCWSAELAGSMVEKGHPPAICISLHRKEYDELNPGQLKLKEAKGY